MNRISRVALVLAAAVALATTAFAQMPPTPGPEHEILKRDVGTWDFTLEMTIPGMGPLTMNGTETNTLMAGRWLLGEFKGEVMGTTLEGHGIRGWDPDKKAYVGVSVDSMSTSFSQSETTYDEKTNTLKGTSESQNPMGGRSKSRVESTWPTPETRVMKIWGPDATAEPTMKITYTRRK
jgi:hypothetical protein